MRKSFRIFCFILIVLGSSATAFYFFWMCPRYSVPILMYHSFDNGRGLLSVSPEHFERQMRVIKEGGYHVISLDEAVSGMKKGRVFPHRMVVITIDDGYRNNYTAAYPILRKYGFPATIFLISHVMGKEKSFVAGEAFLTWDQAREMSRHGISFGAHTRNHPYLPKIKDKNILWDEIAGSKKDIEEHLGKAVDYFCYPNGGFTRHIEELVEKAGYKGACTTNRGYDVLNREKFYEINRISVRNVDPFKGWVNFIRFRAKLMGYYCAFQKGKPGH